ncbi:carbohydrate ABC transporter permease [Leucothrix mucor]|jgi:sorbitol/mannitol transport system permease protein|uniref:carbohydrate ABC transporter permease n=1 Tax=Leucothrix mucor TaxID=45248 RepID=UPI0003B33C75|nr:sugar ABC transporter permease [Leucothrix mucor]
MRTQAQANRFIPRLLMSPAVITLLMWMIIPLGMTIYFSLIRYNLMQPDRTGFVGWQNYEFFVTNPAFSAAVLNTVVLLGSVVAITVIFGLAIALLINDPFPGQSFVRILLISPFFVMPTVNALLWKHMMMNPIYGVLAQVWMFFGLEPVNWLQDLPLLSIIIMVSWQWLPFACLIFITSLQSMDREQLEASSLDGATYLQKLRYLYVPHMARSMTVVVMIEVIFLLSIFAEIYTTTAGGPGTQSTNLAFLIFTEALLNFDVGSASAGALFAIVLANIVAIFLIRIVGKNLD